MSVKHYILDGKAVHSLDELYNQLAAHLTFPAYFGRNLDALWDVLTTDIPGEIEIIWTDSHISQQHMGEDYERAINIFRELEKHRHDFKLTIE